MGLAKVWVRTFTNELIRADRIIGLSTHPTPAISGKAGHWLVDATIAVSVGSGTREGLDISVLHRTLIQARAQPVGALEAFAQLLSGLSDRAPAGIVSARVVNPEATGGISHIEFSFKPFPESTDVTSSKDHIVA